MLVFTLGDLIQVALFAVLLIGALGYFAYLKIMITLEQKKWKRK